MTETPLERTVRGARPRFHEDASTDRLVAMVLALTSEVAALRHRLDSFQSLAERNGWLTEGALDAFDPDLPERESRERWREDMLKRVFHIVEQELAELRRGEDAAGYWRAVDDVERGA